MAQIRSVMNVKLDVITPDGKSEKRTFFYGEFYLASRWEVIDDEYCNIQLKDGSRIEGIQNTVFENFGTPMFDATTTETQVVEKIEKEEEDDDDVVTLEGTIISDETED